MVVQLELSMIQTSQKEVIFAVLRKGDNMRLIDADALLNEVFERHCKNCGKRKGMKNGQYKVIYEIGEAPCRACEIDDMTDYLENAPTVDATEVIRCKDCKHYNAGFECLKDGYGIEYPQDYFCGSAERRQDG